MLARTDGSEAVRRFLRRSESDFPASLKRFIRLNETESCLSRRRLYDGLVCGPVPVSADRTESAVACGAGTALGRPHFHAHFVARPRSKSRSLTYSTHTVSDGEMRGCRSCACVILVHGEHTVGDASLRNAAGAAATCATARNPDTGGFGARAARHHHRRRLRRAGPGVPSTAVRSAARPRPPRGAASA